MEEKVDISNFLIELDCLLDTRLCILDNLVDLNTISDFIVNKYHIRKTDNFPGVSFSKFSSEYKKRNKATLKNALPTYMQKFVLDFANSTIENSIYTPFKQKPLLTVNIYPYVFSKEEEIKLIKSLSLITGQICDIKLVSLSIDMITPSYVKENLSILCMYNYADWIEYHSKNENFKKVTCPEVTLIGPMISFKEEYRLENEESKKAFELMEQYMSPLINLILFPISMFSFKVTKTT